MSRIEKPRLCPFCVERGRVADRTSVETSRPWKATGRGRVRYGHCQTCGATFRAEEIRTDGWEVHHEETWTSGPLDRPTG